jgi:hypothetical protein
MKQTIFLFFILASFSTMAQSITSANLSWQISREDNVSAGTFDDRGGAILSYGTIRVEWNDAKGTPMQTLTIREVNGSWANVQNNGTIVYEADSEGKPATVTFLRDDTQLRVTIAVLQDDGFPLIREFTIQNITKL